MEQMIALAERRGEKEYADILKGKDTAGPNIIGFKSNLSFRAHQEYAKECREAIQAYREMYR